MAIFDKLQQPTSPQPTPHQQEKLDGILSLVDKGEKYITLSGYAGVGKSFSANYLVKQLQNKFSTIAISATTNKALKVIKQQVNVPYGVEYRTIHSILNIKAVNADSGEVTFAVDDYAEKKFYDVVIVDEVSMLNDELLDYIFDFSDNTIFIFIGDPMQLPPVNNDGISNVFNNDHHFTLTEIVRQAEGNPIIGVSMKIRESINNNVRVTLQDLKEWIGVKNKTCIITSKSKALHWNIEAHKKGKDCRIMAYSNKTVLGYNAYLHRNLHPDAKLEYSIGETVIFQDLFQTTDGEFIMNSEELKIDLINNIVYKGVESYEMSSGRYKFIVPKDMNNYEDKVAQHFAKWRSLKKCGDFKHARAASALGWELKDSFANVRHTYAITTHKSQGSTFEIGVIDFADLNGIWDDMEFNRALYVAFTRASNNVIIIGNKN